MNNIALFKGNSLYRFLLFVSFMEGAVVMIVELVGAKIVAPYYGSSLYVWSSVLGVTLAGLAVGYFVGGVLSNKYKNLDVLFLVILLGALFSGIAPNWAPWLMSKTEFMGVRMGAFFSVLGFLFPPIVCMGMVSPLVIQQISTTNEDAGKSAGTVYAVSTVGGILATFLAGFYLIPTLGITYTAWMSSLVFIILGLSYFLIRKSYSTTIAIVVLAFFITNFEKNQTLSSGYNIQFKSSGILGEWMVLDHKEGTQNGKEQITRRLLLNGIDQTFTQVGYEPLSLWKYPHQITAYSSIKPKGAKALLLGMGGGSIAYELQAMGFDLDVVELDERIETIAKEYFNFDPTHCNLIIDDARHYIRKTIKKYDVVIIDLLIGEVQPHHLFTKEAFGELKKLLNEEAIIVINFQGTLSHPEFSIGPKSIYKTLQSSGYYVDYYTSQEEAINEITNDIFFIAALEDIDFQQKCEKMRYNDWFTLEQFNYKKLFTDQKIDVSNAYILEDDKPILEHLNASAILNWRGNKIKQNIRKILQKGLNIY